MRHWIFETAWKRMENHGHMVDSRYSLVIYLVKESIFPWTSGHPERTCLVDFALQVGSAPERGEVL
jgi:hypothetical protein